MREGAGASAYRQDELIRAGVWTVLQGTQGGGTAVRAVSHPWASALINDAEPRAVYLLQWRTFGTDPVARGLDVTFFKTALASGEASIFGTTMLSGVPVYRVRAWLPNERGSRGATATADVRRSDLMPIRVVVQPDVAHTVTYRYLVLQEVPRVTGLAHLTLDIPAGIPVSESRTLSVAQAAAYPHVKAWWLGRSFEGLAFAPVGHSGTSPPIEPGLQLSRYVGPPSPMIGSGGGTFPSTSDRLLSTGPRLGATSVNAVYGDLPSAEQRHPASPTSGKAFMMVTSYPATDTANWVPRFWTSPRWTTIAGRRALLYSTAVGGLGAGQHAVVDTGDATVVVAGLGVTREQIERAATSLVRVR
jgi:hypothetical protein